MKNQLIEKNPEAGKDERQKEQRVAEDETIGWHRPLSGREFEQTPGGAEGREPGVLQFMESQRVRQLSN